MINRLILQIQSLKTSIFDIAALIYGIGLLNWSIYAYNNRLGIISAIDMQYFTAGLVPFLLLAMTYYALVSEFSIYKKATNYIRSRMRNFKRENPEGFKRFRITLLSAICLIGLCYGAYTAYIEKSYWLLCYFLFLIGLAAVAAFFSKRMKQKPGSRFKQMRKQYRYNNFSNIFLVGYSKVIITVVAMLFIVIYALLLYPKLPQELGGAKPKRCILECKKGTYNNFSTLQLFTDTTSSILRSKEVNVCYYNTDKIIISYTNDEYREQIAELNRKDIVLINWLD